MKEASGLLRKLRHLGAITLVLEMGSYGSETRLPASPPQQGLADEALIRGRRRKARFGAGHSSAPRDEPGLGS